MIVVDHTLFILIIGIIFARSDFLRLDQWDCLVIYETSIFSFLNRITLIRIRSSCSSYLN